MVKKVIYKLSHNKYYYHLYRNQLRLNKQKVKKNCINLEWWDKKTNLGDELAPIIYNWIMEKNQLDPDKNIGKTVHLTTVGSLIGQGDYDAVVWGSGILDIVNARRLVRQHKFRKLDVRAVRGPITYNVLKSCGYDCPKVFGDPAILMPYIYMPKETNKKVYDVSVILHHSQEDTKIKDYHTIDIQTKDYAYFIDEICKSRKVISSSLHGIILAETYNVPAVFLKSGMDDEITKFFDWYYSTGRTNLSFADSLEEALEVEVPKLPKEEKLEEMRKALLEAFPYDLWK